MKTSQHHYFIYLIFKLNYTTTNVFLLYFSCTSILFSPSYSIHLSTLVLFSSFYPLESCLVHSVFPVHFGYIRSIWSYSVHFGYIWSTLVLLVYFDPIWSILSTSVLFGLLWFYLIHSVQFCSSWSNFVLFGQH